MRAHGGNYLQERVADVTVSLLSFPNGVRAHIFVSWLHPYKEQKLVVVGDRKMAVFDDMSPDRKLLIYSHTGSDHPTNAAELTNSTGKTLDGGPITVYDAGAYAGESSITTRPAGSSRYSVFSGSSARQWEGGDESSNACA